MERLERYSESEKMVVKNNRKIFYRNGLYIINCLLEKNGDEISFSDLKKINSDYDNNINIVKKGNRLFLVKENFSVLKDNGYEMIKDSLGIFRFVRSEDVK